MSKQYQDNYIRAPFWGFTTWCWTALIGIGKKGMQKAEPKRAGEVFDEL